MNQVHAFDKDNLQIYFHNIETFRPSLLKANAIWSEQLAHQYCNIASHYCNVARKRTSGLTVIFIYIIYTFSVLVHAYDYQRTPTVICSIGVKRIIVAMVLIVF